MGIDQAHLIPVDVVIARNDKYVTGPRIAKTAWKFDQKRRAKSCILIRLTTICYITGDKYEVRHEAGGDYCFDMIQEFGK
jgi:hypothetical protein